MCWSHWNSICKAHTSKCMNLTRNLMYLIMFWKWETGAHDSDVPIRMEWKWNRIMKWFVSICLFAEIYYAVNYRLCISPCVCVSLSHSWNLPIFLHWLRAVIDIINHFQWHEIQSFWVSSSFSSSLQFQHKHPDFRIQNVVVLCAWMWTFVCLRFFLFAYFVLAHIWINSSIT